MAIKKQSQYGEEFDRWCDENYVDPNDPNIKFYYDDFIDEKMQNAYDEQERSSDPIQALLDLYRQYEEKDSEQERVANDPEAMQWLKDYWAFICWLNNGNQASLEEIGRFVGMQYTFSDVDNVIEALSNGGEDYDTLDDDQKDLIDRLKNIAGRYGYMSKTSKSNDIHSMIAQIRNNNNSLVKSRMRLNKSEQMLHLPDGNMMALTEREDYWYGRNDDYIVYIYLDNDPRVYVETTLDTAEPYEATLSTPDLSEGIIVAERGVNHFYSKLCAKSLAKKSQVSKKQNTYDIYVGARFEDNNGNWYEVTDDRANIVTYKFRNAYGLVDGDMDYKDAFLVMLNCYNFHQVK